MRFCYNNCVWKLLEKVLSVPAYLKACGQERKYWHYHEKNSISHYGGRNWKPLWKGD